MNPNINLCYSVLKINLFDLIVSFFIKIKLLLPIVSLIKNKQKLKNKLKFLSLIYYKIIIYSVYCKIKRTLNNHYKFK